MDVPRYEVNRLVRTVLSRHDIDLTRVDYSFIGGTVYLSGDLLKNSESDLAPTAIENLLKEISGLSGVRDLQTDFQNWIVSNAGGAWQIKKGKKSLHDISAPLTRLGGVSEAAQDVHIRTSEKIADILKDMQKKPEEKDG